METNRRNSKKIAKLLEKLINGKISDKDFAKFSNIIIKNSSTVFDKKNPPRFEICESNEEGTLGRFDVDRCFISQKMIDSIKSKEEGSLGLLIDIIGHEYRHSCQEEESSDQWISLEDNEIVSILELMGKKSDQYECEKLQYSLYRCAPNEIDAREKGMAFSKEVLEYLSKNKYLSKEIKEYIEEETRRNFSREKEEEKNSENEKKIVEQFFSSIENLDFQKIDNLAVDAAKNKKEFADGVTNVLRVRGFLHGEEQLYKEYFSSLNKDMKIVKKVFVRKRKKLLSSDLTEKLKKTCWFITAISDDVDKIDVSFDYLFDKKEMREICEHLIEASRFKNFNSPLFDNLEKSLKYYGLPKKMGEKLVERSRRNDLFVSSKEDLEGLYKISSCIKKSDASKYTVDYIDWLCDKHKEELKESEIKEEQTEYKETFSHKKIGR